MNLYRGFRRITLLLSIIVTMTVWFWFSEGRFRITQQKQKALEEDAEQYRCFWHCWDAQDFLGASRRMIIQDLLTGPDKLKAVIVPEGDGARVLWLAPDIVFPGIENLGRYLDTNTLPSGILRISDIALDEAAQAARAKCLALEPHFSSRFICSPREMLTSSIVRGIPIAGGTFGAVWLLFLLFRWIACGFYSGAAKTARTPTQTEPLAIVPGVPEEFDSEPLTQETVEDRSY